MKTLYTGLNFYFRKVADPSFYLLLRSLLVVLIGLLSIHFSFAQITITQNSTATTLAQLLTGTGVTISNITKTCDNNGSGTFVNGGNDLGIAQGVVLSTGKVQSISQPASSFASTQFTNSSDAQLSTLTSGPIYDKCILEFDITPQGSTLQFNYVFGSEEYPEFVCSPYNDVFGFFITGPNPGGGNYTNKNLAIIPNSNLPVCINTVNPGVSGTYMGNTWNSSSCLSLSNSNLYTDNLNPVDSNIVYDGMTKTMTATASVVPCQTYHLKIAIADVGDRIFDSGVFLQAYSFTSTPYNVSISSAINNPAYSTTYEGCFGGTYTVTLSAPQSTDLTVNLKVSGTATNGVDYDSIPNKVVIPAGQTSVTILMNPHHDNIVEPTETVKVAIINNCAGIITDSTMLTINDDIIPTITATDTTLCPGQSNQFTVTGGGTYSWSPSTGLNNTNTSNPIATPATTTTYTASVTVGSCVNTVSKKIYVSNPSVSIASTPGDTICTAGPIQLNATPTGGISPYKYLWSNSNTTSTISSSTTGTYNVVATDSFGCTATASHSVIVSNLSVTGTITPITCFGHTDGAITLNVTGGNSPFHYLWNDANTSANRTNLSGGTYTVTAYNAVNCAAIDTFTLIQPVSALSGNATATPVSCFGGNTGSINLAVTGGVQPYHYIWSNSATTQNLSNLTSNTYSATVTDLGGCSATASVNVSQPTALTASETHTNISCYNDTTGSINITTTGGTTPYTYLWSNTQTSQNISNLKSGNYSVTITDKNSCSTTKTANITQPTAFTLAITPTNPGCSGGNTGSVHTTVSGGTPSYSYLWNNSSTAQNITSLGSGSYSVTITDNNGCKISDSATLGAGGSLTAEKIQSDVTCNNGNNGVLSFNVSGGTEPYSYNWGGGVTSPVRSNLTAGNYNVTITDINSCSATISATIKQPTPVNISFVRNDVTCYGLTNGSITASASGGTSPYTYNWGGGITGPNRTNLAAGNYQVIVTDSNSCTVSNTAGVIQPPSSLTGTANTTAVLCSGGNDGNISLSINGGTAPYSYNWGNNITTSTRINVSAGNYTVTVSDANTCTAVINATVSQPAAAVNATGIVTNTGCNGSSDGSVKITATGGTPAYSYSWSNGNHSAQVNSLSAGDYLVTVTDANGCTFNSTFTVQQPAVMLIAPTTSNISCYGGKNGTINLDVAGGTPPYFYKWASGDSSKDIHQVVAGNYTVKVSDSKNCNTQKTITVTQPTALLVQNSTTDVKCNGGNNGNIHINSTGGAGDYSYLWSNHSTDADQQNIPAGTYTVTVTDANSCTTTASAIVSQPTPIAIVSTPTNNKCNGDANGAINITSTGGAGSYNFKWSNASQNKNITGLKAGNYTLTVTDINSCTSTTQITITDPQPISFTPDKTDVHCNGQDNGSIAIIMEGGVSPYKFNWSNGASTQNITNLSSGLYSVTATDSNGCHASLNSIPVNEPAAISLVLSTTDITCYGSKNGKVESTINGGTSPYQYIWSNQSSATSLTGLDSGSYTLTITDASNCPQTASAVITTNPGMIVSATSNAVPCPSAYSDIYLSVSSGVAPYTFTWNNGVTTQNLEHVHPGSYKVVIRDANNCPVDTSFTIINQHTFDVSAFGGGTIKLGESIELYATSTGSSLTKYEWMPPSGLSCTECSNTMAKPGETTLYTVIGTDTNGCMAQDTVSVIVISDHTYFAPNVFTPNGDGVNDFFEIYGNLDGVQKMNIMIFDRWGEKVFESSEADFKWDGIYKGKLLPPSVYVYTIKLAFLDGNEKTNEGSITLLR